MENILHNYVLCFIENYRVGRRDNQRRSQLCEGFVLELIRSEVLTLDLRLPILESRGSRSLDSVRGGLLTTRF